MFRKTAASILCGLVAIAAGCRMCASTHDSCGPMCKGECGGHGDAIARAGSILSGKVTPPESGQLMDEQIPYDEEIASGVILSVTDTKLEQPKVEETDFEQPVDVSETPHQEAELASQGRSVEWQGWTTAKRAETRVQ